MRGELLFRVPSASAWWDAEMARHPVHQDAQRSKQDTGASTVAAGAATVPRCANLFFHFGRQSRAFPAVVFAVVKLFKLEAVPRLSSQQP